MSPGNTAAESWVFCKIDSGFLSIVPAVWSARTAIPTPARAGDGDRGADQALSTTHPSADGQWSQVHLLCRSPRLTLRPCRNGVPGAVAIRLTSRQVHHGRTRFRSHSIAGSGMNSSTMSAGASSFLAEGELVIIRSRIHRNAACGRIVRPRCNQQDACFRRNP